MRRTTFAVVVTAASAWALAGCTETELGTGQQGVADCTSCHGSKDNPAGEAQAAPPRATHGETEPFQPAVGAHQAHLADSASRTALACADCHPVPAALESARHHDGRLDFSWSALATTSDLKPSYDRESGTCSSVWCHGAALSGGSNPTPSWTGGASQAACGACHGLPPPAPHPDSATCNACHPGTVTAGGQIDLAGGQHINGRLDGARYHPEGWADHEVHGPEAVGGLVTCNACHGDDLEGGKTGVSCSGCHGAGWKTNCTFCHGGANDPSGAPPVDTHGQSATTEVTVGAHAAHLKDSASAKALACADCHVVPTDVTSPGHLDGPTATLTWGARATAGGQQPGWDRTSGKCSSTWCHGAGLTGGTNPTPTWTVVDGTEARCGACHGLPPPAPHPTGTDCNQCHAATVAPDGTVNLAAGKHLNGVIDSASPHPAGWLEDHGGEAKATLAACQPCHGQDLSGGTTGISCNKCHSGWQTNCNFCHGGKDNQTGAPPVDAHGRTDTTEVTVGAHTAHVVDGTLRKAFACSECHVVPTDAFSAGHLDGATATLAFGALARTGGLAPTWDRSSAKCASTYCHGTGVQGGTLKTPQWTQVDGSQAACGTCHGNPPAAPHPTGADCAQCHASTVRVDGLIDVAGGKHIDGQVQVTFAHPGGFAAGSVHGPQAEAGVAGCQACHGADLGGGVLVPSCNQCHDGFRTNCVFCHGGSDNQSGAPPATVAGLTDPAVRGVGAHSAHLGASSKLAKPVACDACHTVPADALSAGHMNGTAALAFGALAKAKGATPSFDPATAKCSSVYCHGTTMAAGNGTITTPQWTKVDDTQDACGTCHGRPPSGSFSGYPKKGGTFRHEDGDHPTYRCAVCHPGMGPTDNVTDPALHIDGKTDLTAASTGCDCH